MVHTLVQFVPNSNLATQRAQQPKMQVQAVPRIPVPPYITTSNCIFKTLADVQCFRLCMP